MRWLEATDRCPDHPDAFGAEHLVEAGTELGVPIPNEELDRSTAVYQITTRLRATWVTMAPFGWSVLPRGVHFPSRQFDHKWHVELLE
jgi:hypothetical protein